MAGLLNEKINKNFIVFEGIDGSGKTSIVNLLKDYFERKKNSNVLFTFEPTNQGEWSKKIDEIVRGEVKNITPNDLQLLCILDRKDHIKQVISPALKKEKIVFCDRFFLSTLAYGSASGIHWKTLWNNHKDVIGEDMIMPAFIIFFDTDPEIAISRISQRGAKKTIFENIQNLQKIRNEYLSIGPHFEGFKVINGNDSSEKVLESLKLVLAEYL
ncbi:MAG TPA: dTMP kinase [Candidatus Paceibacterota bacterium]|nr:dTMP kinase [Candidatus Paceibacterota bacterium]